VPQPEYHLIAELARRYDADPLSGSEALSLSPYEFKVYSQNGEDGVLAEIFRRIGAPGRFFVEFGIEWGVQGNSVFLADVMNWRGLFIEGSPEYYQRLFRKYRQNPRVTCLNAMVEPDVVEDLFRQGGVPEEPDLLSIDIDGNDFWVWQAIASFRPRVVAIEYNSSLAAEVTQVQPYRPGAAWDGTDYFGASLGALRLLGEDKGYRLAHTDLEGVNAFFVRSDLYEGLPAADEVPERPAMYGESGEGHPPDPQNRPFLTVEPDD
jgi:hypothetical protein